jgi:glycosyltransferase involved in cell wall biosynthesis
MKILAVHNVSEGSKKTKAVDIWRIYRPIQHLKKNTDWQIDEQPTFIKGIEKYKDAQEFTPEELEKAAKHLGQYDIIWSTYFTNPTFYTLLRVVNAKYGTKFVLDVDDDLFAIKLDNPIWLKLTDENVWHMQCMVRDADYITTTTERLAHVIRERRDQHDDTVFVLPNYIGDDYKNDPIDNGEEIVIGYFGGSSHFNDLDNSGAIEAVQKIMHENKNVRFVSCGMPIEKYLPKQRYSYDEGAPGLAWITDVFPRLNFDIAIAPIDNSRFSQCKSNIKWQESTRMGAAFVGSNIGPYSDLANGVNSLLVKNAQEDWYKALKKLVDDPRLRKTLVDQARKDLELWRVEVNWPHYVEVFKAVKNYKAGVPTLLLTQH